MKTGWMKETRSILQDNADIGHAIEPVAMKLFHDRTGYPVENFGDFCIATDDRWPWLFATHDVFTEDPDRGLGVVEIKAVSGGASSQWKEGPPLYYQVQIQQEMLVAGATWGAFAVLFGGPSWRFQIYPQEFHPGFGDKLIRETEAFWKLVTTQEPPDIDESEHTTECLRAKYFAEVELSTVELGADFIALDRERQALMSLASMAEKRKKGIDNLIRAKMGTAEIGLVEGRPVYKHSTPKNGSRRLIRIGKKGADSDE
jgi:predicted phage-related endonuclease